MKMHLVLDLDQYASTLLLGALAKEASHRCAATDWLALNSLLSIWSQVSQAYNEARLEAAPKRRQGSCRICRHMETKHRLEGCDGNGGKCECCNYTPWDVSPRYGYGEI